MFKREQSQGANKLMEAFNQANLAMAELDGLEFIEPSIFAKEESKTEAYNGDNYDTVTDVYNTASATKEDSHIRRVSNRVRATVAVGAMAVVGLFGLGMRHSNEASASQVVSNSNGQAASNEGVQAYPEAPAAQAVSVAEHEKANQTEAMDQAIQDKLAEIGLKPGQYTEVTDPNAALPGPAEANYYSLNGGSQVWGNYERTINGAKQMSQDLLNAHDEFSSDRAFVSMAAMKHFGASDKLLAQLAAGNYDDIEIKFFTLNGDKAVYHDMSFNNNGSLGIENDRTVAPLSEDAITIISFKDENGAIKTISTRVDCGVMQAFGSVTVYGTPPQPVVSKPSKPARPSKPEKPCPPGTTAPPTTTPETTPPTTVPPTTTPETTPPTTVPPTTTPETTPPTTTIPPKDDPDTVPGPGTGHGETPTEPATPDDGSDNPVGGTVPTPTTPPTTPETPPTTPPTTTRPVTPNEEPVYTQPPAPVG